MPAVNFYLNQKILEAVRARAKAYDISVSKIIQESIEQYLNINEAKVARERILKSLARKKPLGGMKAWEEYHNERTEADVDRC